MNKITEYYSFTVDQTQLRLDQYLADRLPDISRSKIKHYIKNGQVTINGVVVKPSLILKGKETIECCFKKENIEKTIKGEKIDLDIIYEDKYIAVINKPAGLVVHPGTGNYSGTLLNGLVYHFKKLSHPESHRPGLVHRLDKDTSGLIIIAKNDKVHESLSKQFSLRQVYKEYQALVWGKLDEKGVIKGNIDRHPKYRQQFTVVENGGRESLTEYELNEYYAPLSFIKLFPKTGRTHQLRVHLKSLGHPILSDEMYGGGIKYARSFHVKYTQIINRLFKVINRVALHSKSIQICHPDTKKTIKFDAPLPQDLKMALDILNYD